jgi:hypothetical protein
MKTLLAFLKPFRLLAIVTAFAGTYLAGYAQGWDEGFSRSTELPFPESKVEDRSRLPAPERMDDLA